MSEPLRMEGRIFASFHSTERSEPEELIEPTLSVCAKLGLASKSSTPLDPDKITLSDRNRVVVYDGNRQVRLNFRIEDWSGAIDSVLNIKTPANGFVSTDADPDNEYTGFARDFVDLIRDLTVELDPVYVSTHNTHVDPNTPSPETVIPFETPIELERIPWLGVYSKLLIDWFGGRDHVLETPAWKVTELENGCILIVTTRTPWKDYHSKLPADYHLLGEADVETVTADNDSSGLSDPFATLDKGDFGADVCVNLDDISKEFVNEDLHLVRVRIDERGDLCRVDTDTFVRNVVEDTTGGKADVIERMLEDIPADATRDEQMISSLLHESIPPSFVRLDNPDDENVVTKVMELDVDTNKHDTLISLGRVAQQDDFIDDNLQAVLGALDTLADLEDIDRIDEYIADLLF